MIKNSTEPITEEKLMSNREHFEENAKKYVNLNKDIYLTTSGSVVRHVNIIRTLWARLKIDRKFPLPETREQTEGQKSNTDRRKKQKIKWSSTHADWAEPIRRVSKKRSRPIHRVWDGWSNETTCKNLQLFIDYCKTEQEGKMKNSNVFNLIQERADQHLKIIFRISTLNPKAKLDKYYFDQLFNRTEADELYEVVEGRVANSLAC